MNVGSGIRGPRRPTSAVNTRLEALPPRRPQDAKAKRFVRSQFRSEGNESACLMGAGTCPSVSKDTNLKFGTLLTLAADLLAAQEFQAVSFLFQNLASSKLADAELMFTPLAFKVQLAKFLKTHVAEITSNVTASIQRCIGEDSKFLSEMDAKGISALSPPTVASQPTTIRIVAPASQSKFRFARPRRRLALSAPRSPSRSREQSLDCRGKLPSETGDERKVVPNRTSFRQDDVEVPDWMCFADGENSNAVGHEGIDKKCVSKRASSHCECDADASLEHRAIRRSGDSFDDESDVNFYVQSGVVPTLSPIRAALLDGGVEHLHGEFAARRHSNQSCYEGARETVLFSRAVLPGDGVEASRRKLEVRAELGGSRDDGARENRLPNRAPLLEDSIENSYGDCEGLTKSHRSCYVSALETRAPASTARLGDSFQDSLVKFGRRARSNQSCFEGARETRAPARPAPPEERAQDFLCEIRGRTKSNFSCYEVAREPRASTQALFRHASVDDSLKKFEARRRSRDSHDECIHDIHAPTPASFGDDSVEGLCWGSEVRSKASHTCHKGGAAFEHCSSRRASFRYMCAADSSWEGDLP